ncbi:hypothetical protein EAI_05428 [Harpegnathos saltator]|uniref:Uncharacterized protein n=1 Tax=Harpegnathos saltator TaxID=610380 RepID=E2BRP5_HARSA|nr:hypothetical protein EAI_05428 [Harpegnathos saltator]
MSMETILFFVADAEDSVLGPFAASVIRPDVSVMAIMLEYGGGSSALASAGELPVINDGRKDPDVGCMLNTTDEYDGGRSTIRRDSACEEAESIADVKVARSRHHQANVYTLIEANTIEQREAIQAQIRRNSMVRNVSTIHMYSHCSNIEVTIKVATQATKRVANVRPEQSAS